LSMRSTPLTWQQRGRGMRLIFLGSRWTGEGREIVHAASVGGRPTGINSWLPQPLQFAQRLMASLVQLAPTNGPPLVSAIALGRFSAEG
jgi:hypothetical protein